MNVMYEVLNALNTGIVLIDDNRKIVFFNCWVEEKTGILLVDVINESIGDVFARFEEERYLNVLESVAETKHVRFLSGAIHGTFFTNVKKPAKKVERQNLHINCLENNYVMIHIEDVTQQFKEQLAFKKFMKELTDEKDSFKVKEERERHLARTDTLTGLNNRLALNNYLNEKIEKGRIFNNSSQLALFFIDLDDFKKVNDSCGHKCGDRVLQLVGKRLKNTVRQDDFVARLSGDEFVIVLNGNITYDIKVFIAEKLCEVLKQPYEVGEHRLNLSASIGIATYPQGKETIDSILDKADKALYISKQNGKGKYTIYNNQKTI